ncbi:MAG: hypothetical protein ACQ9MH_27125, partial [Nitrospinales bacterium]
MEFFNAILFHGDGKSASPISIDKPESIDTIKAMKLCRKTMKRSLRRFYLDLRFNAPRLKRFAAVAAFGGRVDKGILVAGPYIGELGYEIGEWAPHIKWLASHLNCRTHVFARKGREVLYPFAEEVQTID